MQVTHRTVAPVLGGMPTGAAAPCAVRRSATRGGGGGRAGAQDGPTTMDRRARWPPGTMPGIPMETPQNYCHEEPDSVPGRSLARWYVWGPPQGRPHDPLRPDRRVSGRRG